MSDATTALAAAQAAAASSSTASEAADFAAEKAVEVNADRVAAQTAKIDAETARDDAETFALGFGPGTATTLAPGATPTLDITGPAGAKVLDLGIPAAEVDDASLTALDANAASAYRVQSDARLSTTIAAQATLKPTTDLGDWSLLRRDTSDVTKGVSWTTSSAIVARALGWIIVTEYGAVGDGTTDDTAAIRAALDAAALRTLGTTVYFGPGTYRVTNTLHPTANGGAGIWTANRAVFLVGDKTALLGAGRGQTTIAMEFANLTSSATADSRLVFAVGDDFTAEGIHFQGNYNPGTWAFFPSNNDNGVIGPRKATTYRQAIRKCKFSYLPGFYVGTMVTHGAEFTNNIVDHCANGYNVNGSSTRVEDNEFYYSEGVEAAGAIASPSTSPNGRIQVSDNSFFECSVAASLGGNTGTTTDHDSFGYIFEGNTVHNVAVVSNAQVVIANNARAFSVVGNTFRGEFKFGVNVTQGGNANTATTPRDGQIAANTFDQTLDGATTIGYAVGWAHTDGKVMVSGNMMLMGPNQTAMISSGLTPAETIIAGNYIYARYALTQTSSTTSKTVWSSTNIFVPSDASPRYSITTGAALTESVYTPAAHRVSLMGQTEYPEFVSRLRGVGTETNDAIAVHKRYYSGKYEWGPNTGAAVDTSLERTAVGTLSLGAANTIRTGRAVTASRPSAATVGAGAMFYDTTLSKPIWSDGTVWRDAAGTAV